MHVRLIYAIKFYLLTYFTYLLFLPEFIFLFVCRTTNLVESSNILRTCLTDGTCDELGFTTHTVLNSSFCGTHILCLHYRN